MIFAVIGHVTVGTRETASLEPHNAAGKVMANWVQTMCAFQMLTVDLLIVVGLLLTIGLSDVLGNERLWILLLAGYFALNAVLWLGHVLWFKRDGATLRTLPHWAVWLICSGLLLIGA